MTGYRTVCLALSALLIIGCCGTCTGVREKMSVSIVMDDTTASYDIWLMLRTPRHVYADSLLVSVNVTAPDGIRQASDTLIIPMNRDLVDSGSLKGIRGCSSMMSYDLEALYRTGVRPGWSGEWRLSFTVEPPIVEEMWAEAVPHSVLDNVSPGLIRGRNPDSE